MGFSLVVEELIKARKPLVGHNMIYDVAYLYNQFVDHLPEEYIDFVKAWNANFPQIYDTKVIATGAEYFGRTVVEKIFEKCTTDNRLRFLASVSFDIRNGFTRYENSGILSFAHEAAYDAYMTGVCFAHIMRYKEVSFEKGSGNSNQKGKPKHKSEKMPDIKQIGSE